MEKKQKINKSLFLLLVLFVFIINFNLVVAEIDSQTFPQTGKQNQCFNMVFPCYNCTSVNITSFQLPDLSSVIYTPEKVVTITGNSCNYTFCQTSLIGQYTMNVQGICDGHLISQPMNFNVTPSGFTSTLGFFIIFIVIIGLILMIGIILKNKWIMALGSFLVILFGFFIIINGIDIIKDTRTTWAIGLIVWALGIYFMYLSVEEMLKEWD